MHRIYLAGLFSKNSIGLEANVLEVLDNMRRGMRVGTELLLKGFAPFVLWHDYHFALMLQGDERLTKKSFYDFSLTWLTVCEAVFVISNSENSMVNNEIEKAHQLKIPVFYSIDDLEKYFNDKESKV